MQAQNLTQKYFQTTSEYHFIQQCACPLSQYTAHSGTCPEGAFPEEPLDGWCKSQGGLEENIMEQDSDDFLLGHFWQLVGDSKKCCHALCLCVPLYHKDGGPNVCENIGDH